MTMMMQTQPLMDPNQTVNWNAIEGCLKSANHWGKTVYYNVCNGNQYTVQWGTVDYLAPILISAVVISLVLVLLAFSFMVATERF